MDLTEDQQTVVGLKTGRHLVLAPPGSGKTEMLSRRILDALSRGIPPERMLCATFTTRAAFEMRDRLAAVSQDGTLPEVGNIHHFCHRFLRSVGRLHPGIHVLDDVQQLEFVEEVVDVLREELKSGKPADLKRTHGVAVLGLIKGIRDPMCLRLHELAEKTFAAYFEKGKSPIPDLLTAVSVIRQRRCGIPSCFLRQVPAGVFELFSSGCLDAVELAYRGLKRMFQAVDFDDLLNGTYLYLEANPLPDSRRYDWVQVDEVQDLNPIQWHIVREFTSSSAVSVYFGDVEQSIFSFLGASTLQFNAAVSDCARHYFRTNFRSTPILLEMLMRYSLTALRSEWEFLPVPCDMRRHNGELLLSPDSSTEAVVGQVRRQLETGVADNVALLVRENSSADAYEKCVRELGYRMVKVSGQDLFAYAPMRDFMAFVSLLGGYSSRVSWTLLVRRFAAGVYTRTSARYFVRSMYAVGFDPSALLAEKDPIPFLPTVRSRRGRWAWRHRRALSALRARIGPAVRSLADRLDRRGSFRELFSVFASLTLADKVDYSQNELWPERKGDDAILSDSSTVAFCEHARERIESFLRYADHAYRDDSRTLREILKEDGERLSGLKEADLLVGDEKVVISTIHKAKGRQFDAVIVPDVQSMLKPATGEREDEELRLLYVAMSRAKRHLSLFGADENGPLRDVAQCFCPGYEPYYLRRDRGEDLNGDWLCEWEHLAAINRRRECPSSLAEAAPATGCDAIERMLLRTLRWSSERRRTIERYRRALITAVADTAIACLADVACCDTVVIDEIRMVALVSADERVAGAALDYFRRLLTGSADPALRQRLADGLHGLLYSRSGIIRREAAALMLDCGDCELTRLVTGAAGDFKRLATVPDARFESMLRGVLSHKIPERYEHALREIIFSRAQS